MFKARYVKRFSGTTNKTIRRSSWDKEAANVSSKNPSDRKLRDYFREIEDYAIYDLIDGFKEENDRAPSPLEYESLLREKINPSEITVVEEEDYVVDFLEELLEAKQSFSKSTKDAIEKSLQMVSSFEQSTSRKVTVSNFNYQTCKSLFSFEVTKNSIKTAKLRMTYVLKSVADKKKSILRKDPGQRTSSDEKTLLLPDFNTSDFSDEYGRQGEGSQKQYLNIEEVLKIYQGAQSLDDRYRYFLSLYTGLFFTGMRISELIDARASAIVERTVSVGGELKKVRGIVNESRKGKQQDLFTPCNQILLDIINERPIPVENPTLEPLIYNFSGMRTSKNMGLKLAFKEFVKVYPNSELCNEVVIVDYKKGTRNETRKKLYETLTPHTARHGFGAMMLQNGIPMQTVSELLGHKSIKVTEKWYKHIDLTKDVHKANLLIDQAVRSFEKEREDTTPPQNLSSPGGA